jgi:guanosine-3',5'-bis(diphosphate) 3'-pyrophosphohydrolase
VTPEPILAQTPPQRVTQEQTMKGEELKTLMRALEFAARKHKDQRRKDADASPYINHPITLASILVNEGHVTDLATICGALLHDTIEDTRTTREELEAAFGAEIAGIVVEVTDDKALEKPQRKQAQIDHAPHLSTRAKAVKLADKIANLRDVAACPPPDWPLARRQGYFDWARRVIDGLRGSHPVLEAAFDAEYARRPEG